jgi:dihydropteroate synthase
MVMGVLNVTPDSFFDGGRYADVSAALARGLSMIEEGADILDVGGESTRPGADRVSAEEECARVLPVVEGLVARGASAEVPISIDTRTAHVASRALSAGATIVNDVSGGADPGMFAVVRDAAAGMVLMHMRGTPRTMQSRTDYVHVVDEVRGELRVRMDAALQAGVPAERLAVDPGLGFSKTAGQSLMLLRDVAALRELGRPLVVGPSRKSFVGRVTRADVDDRRDGTAGAVAWLAAHRVDVVRVHDVREMIRVVRMVEAIRDARPGQEPPPWP